MCIVEFPELKYVDENIDPCDNFYEYSCGNFEKYNPKPEKEFLWDNFKIVQVEIDKIAHSKFIYYKNNISLHKKLLIILVKLLQIF